MYHYLDDYITNRHRRENVKSQILKQYSVW
jgi:hypothetical protein